MHNISKEKNKNKFLHLTNPHQPQMGPRPQLLHHHHHHPPKATAGHHSQRPTTVPYLSLSSLQCQQEFT